VSAASCGPIVFHGAGKPDYLIVSDLPLRAPPGAAREVIGIEYMLRARGYRAGKYSIGYQSCDDSSAATGARDLGRCSSNAKAWAADKQVLGVIGPYNSDCAALEIPVANAAPGGPLAMVGTATTDPELTATVPEGAPGTPGKYYPNGIRNFVRLAAPNQFQAAAAAEIFAGRHLRRIFTIDDGEPYGAAVAVWFKRAARSIHVPLVGSATWNPKAAAYAKLVARVVASHPDGVYLSGYGFLHGTVLLKELRRQLGKRVLVVTPDGFSDVGGVLQDAGAAAAGLVTMFAGGPPGDAGPAGQLLMRRVGADKPFQYGALYGAAAASILLDAITRSDATRASVSRLIFHTFTPPGLIGRFGFDREGDPTVGAMMVIRYTAKGIVLAPTVYANAKLAKG
jgi:branched-chain amino acid transport system substrate-binding protein